MFLSIPSVIKLPFWNYHPISNHLRLYVYMKKLFKRWEKERNEFERSLKKWQKLGKSWGKAEENFGKQAAQHMA